MSVNAEIKELATEQRNRKSMEIDRKETSEILQIINEEDALVAQAVKEQLSDIEEAVEAAYQAIKGGGRIFYAGAGTSGRIGIMDAVECPPTFSITPERVQAVMAGGGNAFLKAVEGAEDDETQGMDDLKRCGLTSKDMVIGIAASGRTPYVKGALKYARNIGAATSSLTNNKNSILSDYAEINIEVLTGPEVLTGSTRMKAATAQKMVLNMISSAVMIKSGKVYENLMVDLHVSNEKLKERAVSIVQTVTDASYDTSLRVLEESRYQVKNAIVRIKTNASYDEAERMLTQAGGFVRKALESHSNEQKQ
ncbi:N-acetylmuramic acid 6-phosphate etherase [Fictibacillus sp. B-59209]|uniref:N-acetylmuramic acid 6-phosphate etherase n=1 Tax=Fictibacillus sp. B-59209 TaxID=3024873 RepID=UPI002E207566|nr:N-acetylmuramic acid 6-phosphate etherase [Fictibacillus sp. B-59209]